MIQTIAPSTLYECDYDLWLNDVIDKLQARDFGQLDVDNLVTELQRLSRRDRNESDGRMVSLLEHLLKRCYVNKPNHFESWQNTIYPQRIELELLIVQSPSLRSYIEERFDRNFALALANVKSVYRHRRFPETWPFDRDLEAILTVPFWKYVN